MASHGGAKLIFFNQSVSLFHCMKQKLLHLVTIQMRCNTLCYFYTNPPQIVLQLPRDDVKYVIQHALPILLRRDWVFRFKFFIFFVHSVLN